MRFAYPGQNAHLRAIIERHVKAIVTCALTYRHRLSIWFGELSNSKNQLQKAWGLTFFDLYMYMSVHSTDRLDLGVVSEN